MQHCKIIKWLNIKIYVYPWLAAVCPSTYIIIILIPHKIIL